MVLLFGVAFAEKKPDTCISCHTDTGSPEAEAFKNDVHFQKGLSCASCHGGDPAAEDMEASMNEAKGFIGVPKPADIPRVCGKCHADMKQQFEAGAHGAALKNSNKGPQCVSCHGIHNIVSVKDKRSRFSRPM